MSLPLFPVYLQSQGYVPPNKGSYYLVAKDGIYFRQEAAHGSTFVKVKKIPHLADAPVGVNLHVPKIDGLTIAKAFGFFREVFTKHRSESYVTLIFNKEHQKYDVWCPSQTVSYSSVNYDRSDMPSEPGWIAIGTIHSHCDFSAFHSGTDTSDESSFDGIHITLGNVNRDEFSMVSSVVFSDNRKQYNPMDLIDGVKLSHSAEVENKGNYRGNRQEDYFKLDISQDEQDVFSLWCDNVLPLWMDRVERPEQVERPSQDMKDAFEWFRHKRVDSWCSEDVKNDVPFSMSKDGFFEVDSFDLHECNHGEDVSFGADNHLTGDLFEEFIDGFPNEDFFNDSEDSLK